MLSLIRSFLFLMGVVLPAAGVVLGQKTPDLMSIRNELKAKVESKELPSISVGVTRGGRVLWKESFGFADIEKRIAATPDTVYALGSLSKSITGTAVFKLVQDGKIDLNRPIDDYLRSTKVNYHGRDPKGYKVYHLLNMAAGIPHSYRYCYVDSGDLRTCEREYLQGSAFSAFGAGEVHLYSNASLGLAARMVADVAGVPFADYIRAAIFRPAGMTRTFTHRSEIKNASKLAAAYRANGSRAAEFQFEPSGGGGFYSSVNDLLKYGAIHLRPSRILSKQTLAEDHRVRPDLPHGYYANGWGVLAIPGHGPTLLSNGAIEGAASTMLVLPESDLVIVVLVNKTVGNDLTDDVAFRIAGSILPGYKAELDRLFEVVGPAFDSKGFEGDPDIDGNWRGEIELNGRRIPLSLSFEGKSVTGSLGTEPAAIESVRVGQGLITATIKLAPADDPFKPMNSSVELIFRREGGSIVGIAQFEVRDDRPQFLKPAFFRLERLKR